MVEFDRGWGTTMSRLPMLAPGKLSDAAFSRAWTRLERQSASPAAAIAMLRMNKDIDVSHVLPVIRVPTLVLHRTATSPSTWIKAAISRRTFPARDMSRWQGTII